MRAGDYKLPAFTTQFYLSMRSQAQGSAETAEARRHFHIFKAFNSRYINRAIFIKKLLSIIP